jgi:hypothetical protein
MMQHVHAHKREKNISYQGINVTGLEIACIHHSIAYQYWYMILI